MKGNKYASQIGLGKPGKRAGTGQGGGGKGGGGQGGTAGASSATRAEMAGGASKKQKRLNKKLDKKRGRESDDEDEEVPPMPALSASANPWDFGQATPGAATAAPATAKKKKGSGSGAGVKTCPAGHALSMFRTPHDEFFCELCGDDQYLPAGAKLFGCRECDWDACEAHTHTDVQRRELARQEQASAHSAERAARAVAKEGSWKVLRGHDKYKNEYLYLRHEGSKLLVELPNHSTGLFTYRSGAGEPARACSESGSIAPFQVLRVLYICNSHTHTQPPPNPQPPHTHTRFVARDASYVCLICMSYVYASYVCLICMPYVYASYVCLICMPYDRSQWRASRGGCTRAPA